MYGREIQAGDVLHWHDGRDYTVTETLDGVMFRDLLTAENKWLTVYRGSPYNVTRTES